MKVRALITIVVGKGIEIAPNEVLDIAESEANRLLEKGFVEVMPKDTTSRSRSTPKKQEVSPIQSSLPDENLNDDDEDGEPDNGGDGDDSDEEDSGNAV